MPKNNQNKIIEHRLTSLEANDIRLEGIMNEIKGDIKSIKENHLNKIYEKLDEIKDQQNKRPGWLITGLCSLVIALIIYLLTVK